MARRGRATATEACDIVVGAGDKGGAAHRWGWCSGSGKGEGGGRRWGRRSGSGDGEFRGDEVSGRIGGERRGGKPARGVM